MWVFVRSFLVIPDNSPSPSFCSIEPIVIATPVLTCYFIIPFEVSILDSCIEFMRFVRDEFVVDCIKLYLLLRFIVQIFNFLWISAIMKELVTWLFTTKCVVTNRHKSRMYISMQLINPTPFRSKKKETTHISTIVYIAFSSPQHVAIKQTSAHPLTELHKQLSKS